MSWSERTEGFRVNRAYDGNWPTASVASSAVWTSPTALPTRSRAWHLLHLALRVSHGHQHAVRERGNAKAAEHVDELGRCVRRVGTDLEVGVHPVQGEALVPQVRPEDGPLEVGAVEPGQGVEPSAVK